MPSDADLLVRVENRRLSALFTVPCTITAGWHHLALERRRAGAGLALVPTTHEGNLAGLAAGSWFATGRPALIHLQNCGLPNLADGILTFAHPRLYAIPMAVVITFRGATGQDASAPHLAVGERTDALVQTIFGREAAIAGDRLGERPVLAELDQVLRHALAGGLAVLKLSPRAFAPTGGAGSAQEPPLPGGDPLALVASLWERQRRGWTVRPGAAAPSREEAIAAIRAAHPGAAVLFCNGYMARAARASGDRASDFFQVGYMGGTLAMGWALARARPELEVVVVDGDQNAQMSAMKDHLLQMYPANLHWYILDNGIGDSVGGVPSLPLSPLYGLLARVIPIRPSGGPFPHPRVDQGGSDPAAVLAALAQRFRRWIAEGQAHSTAGGPGGG